MRERLRPCGRPCGSSEAGQVHGVAVSPANRAKQKSFAERPRSGDILTAEPFVCALPTACVILPYEWGEPKRD